jgi:hypothetical protein
MIIFFTIFLLILINYIIFYVQKPLVKYKQKNEKIVKEMKILEKNYFPNIFFLNNHLNTIIGGSLRLFYPKIEYEREDIKTDEDNVYISIDWVKSNDEFDKILILYPGLTGKFYY